jgi:nucleoside-diphosphate-sugar epimerase
LFHPYGSDQSNRLIPNLADRLRRQETIRLNKDDRPRLTPIYIDDVVTAILRAMDSAYCGTVNIAGDRVVSVRELAEEIGSALNSKPEFEESGKESGDMMGDNSLMKQVLGVWPLIRLSEGVSRTFTREETIG